MKLAILKLLMMLLLQVMVVATVKLTDRISDSQDIIDVTLASDDDHHIQA